MKNLNIITLLAILTLSLSFAQQEKGINGEDNWLDNWTQFNPKSEDYGEATKILSGNITKNMVLSKREVYLLMGSVFVTNGAVLKIEPGTVILGDFKSKGSLTITRGSKIIAAGTETDPVIFSSNRMVKRPGDWGGLVILGSAPVNRLGAGSALEFYTSLEPQDYGNAAYGGQDMEDSSGRLKNVRIEYAGKRISEDTYFNGLLLAGVGVETKISYVMITNAAEDGFEIWGGNTKMYRNVSYKSRGSDFKYNYGARGLIINSLVVRSPYSSNGLSKCLELKSFDKKQEFDHAKNPTFVVANNMSLINTSSDLESDMQMGLVKEAVHVGVGTKLKMTKTVISGFNPAVVLDDEIVINEKTLKKMQFQNMYFNNCNGNIFVENNPNNEDLENWYGNSSFYNVYSKGPNTETFIDFKNRKKPDFRLRINKIMASNTQQK